MLVVITYKSRSFQVDLTDTATTHHECRQLVASGEWTYSDYARVCDLIHDAMHRYSTRPKQAIYIRMRAWRFKASECIEQVICFENDATLEECIDLANQQFRTWYPGWTIDRELVVSKDTYLDWAEGVYALQDWCNGTVNDKGIVDA